MSFIINSAIFFVLFYLENISHVCLKSNTNDIQLIYNICCFFRLYLFI